MFANIDVISPTVANDNTLKFLYETHKNSCHLEYNDSIIEGIMQRQQDLMKNKEDSSYAIFMDDCLGMLPKGYSRKGSKMTYFITRLRHWCTKPHPVLFCWSTQRFRETNPVIRAQATGVLVSSMMRNKKDLEAICEEVADSFGGADNFYKMFNYVRKEKYAWLYCALDKRMVFKNFEELLYDGDKLVKNLDSCGGELGGEPVKDTDEK